MKKITLSYKVEKDEENCITPALMLIVNGSDKDIFDNPKYCPNRTCYTKILNAYYGYYNEGEIEEKYKRNIEIWRKYNLD